VRAFLEFVEARQVRLRAEQLAHLDAGLLRALRRSGVVRDEDPGMVEISVPDLFRALRALYGLRAGGVPVPAKLGPRPMLVGWMGQHADEREVLLVLDPSTGLRLALRRRRRALVLVPTARALTAEMRARHPPGAVVVVEALEETLKAKAGSLVRSGARAPAVVRDRVRRARDATPKTGSRPPRARLAGATRWNQIRICLINGRLVRVDLPGRSVRCTPQDLGMAHLKSTEPTRTWEAFVELCEGNGYFKTRRFGGTEATKQLVSRVRKALRAAFGIRVNPFYRYRSVQGWRSRFQACDRLPDETAGDWQG